jgi:hypothetical protein
MTGLANDSPTKGKAGNFSEVKIKTFLGKIDYFNHE